MSEQHIPDDLKSLAGFNGKVSISSNNTDIKEIKKTLKEILVVLKEISTNTKKQYLGYTGPK